MPKRTSKKLKNSNQIAVAVVALSAELPTPAIDPTPLNSAMISKVMAEMGRKGGKIGGKKSLETMTIAERRKRARKAAKTRWAKKKPKLG